MGLRTVRANYGLENLYDQAKIQECDHQYSRPVHDVAFLSYSSFKAVRDTGFRGFFTTLRKIKWNSYILGSSSHKPIMPTPMLGSKLWTLWSKRRKAYSPCIAQQILIYYR
ncbi:hypothetical protein RchiOBHm_Chr1g0329161 [Rosa chinensis]|uniref:Uncharacterized protein n=1 Tax=Rosa chinensis TaxID=74649 RepID=A0A2P6SAY1_ROSCH|nr:hypothetical protein RchiOBHm_Chr1g0329161 [Rosa chinensis]